MQKTSDKTLVHLPSGKDLIISSDTGFKIGCSAYYTHDAKTKTDRPLFGKDMWMLIDCNGRLEIVHDAIDKVARTYSTVPTIKIERYKATGYFDNQELETVAVQIKTELSGGIVAGMIHKLLRQYLPGYHCAAIAAKN